MAPINSLKGICTKCNMESLLLSEDTECWNCNCMCKCIGASFVYVQSSWENITNLCNLYDWSGDSRLSRFVLGKDTQQGVDLLPSWRAQYLNKRLVSMCSTKEIEILTWSQSQYVFINKSWLFSNSSEHSTWVCDWSTNNFHFSLNIHWLSGSLHSNPFVAKLISRA